MAKKLYIIGIDSTPIWLLKKLQKKEKLEGFNLFNLKNLESTVPPISNPAWTTVYTGLKPDEHKIIDFTGIDRNYERTLLEIEDCNTPTFWDAIANKINKAFIVTPVMILEPSIYKNIDMITGFPELTKYSSKELEEKCKEVGFDGEPDICNQLNRGKLSVKEGCKIYAESCKKRREITQYFIEKNNYDLVFICFSETDRAIHYTLGSEEMEQYLIPMYKEISDFILYLDKRIKDNKEDATVIIMSDHGAQPINHIFLSNSWLVNKGYAKLKDEILEKATKAESQKYGLKEKVVDILAESKFRRTIYKALPRSIQKIGEDLTENRFDYETNGQYIKIKETDLDLKNSMVFASVTHSHYIFIWINDSRFSSPRGNIHIGRQEIMLMIKDSLLKEKFIIKVEDGSKYYKSTQGFIAPDIVAELKEGYYGEFQGYAEDKWIVEPSISGKGGHTMEGLIGIKNYNGKKEEELKINEISGFVKDYFN